VSISDGANYAPTSAARHVVEPGAFRFAVAYLDHGHINGQTHGLIEAGAQLVSLYEPDDVRRQQFADRFPRF
jgi:hypothetical protein